MEKPPRAQIARQFIEKMERGKAPWLTRIPEGQAAPFNPISGTEYKSINAFILMSAGYADPRWMTAKQAAKEGAVVRQGEKGTAILFTERKDENGNWLERPKETWTTLYNAEQVEGLPPLEPRRFAPKPERPALSPRAGVSPKGGEESVLEELCCTMASVFVATRTGSGFTPNPASYDLAARWAVNIRNDPDILFHAATEAEKMASGTLKGESLTPPKPRPEAKNKLPRADPRAEFAEVLRSVGCIVEEPHPIMDDKPHRIRTEGDGPGVAGAGSYLVHTDGRMAGSVTNNRTGERAKWACSGYSPLTEEQKRVHLAKVSQLKEIREKEIARQHDETAKRVAGRLGGEFRPVRPKDESLPYLEKKGISAPVGIYVNDTTKTLCIPMMDIGGKVRSAQYIRPDGTKRFAASGQKSACFFPLGGKLSSLDKGDTIIVTEGLATAQSIAKHTDQPVVVAFDSGNLRSVVAAMRKSYPDKGIVIAADDDRHLEANPHVRKNVGRDKAEAVAQEFNCTVMLPVFSPGEQEKDPRSFTDFNDLAQKSKFGQRGVSAQVTAAVGKALRELL